MADFTGDQLWEVFQRSLRASPKNYAQHQRFDSDWENTPVYDMLESSPVVNLLRQRLPENVGSTQAGQWLLNQLPTPKAPGTGVDKLRRAVENLPLGGYSERDLQEYSMARAEDPILQRYTIEKGLVPVADGVEVPTGDSFRAAAAQAAGAAAGDFVSDGVRNIWWFLNAPQALASLAVLQGMATASPEIKASSGMSTKVPWLKNRNMRMAATVPAWIGMSMAVGNAGREPGYKAVLPSEADPRQTADPLGELASRYLLGRTGSLLPYEEFVKERPDVSRNEYEAYKAYLFGNALPLKATLDGIHGPEVNFMGKSVPLATGLLPAVAAVVGTRYGIRKAGRRLMRGEDGSGQVIRDQNGRPANLLRRAEDLRQEMHNPKVDDRDAARRAYAARQDANESEILKQALLYGAGGMAGAALAGQTLESLRRALKGRAEIEPEEEVLGISSTPVKP